MATTSESTEPQATASTIYCDGTLPPQSSNINLLFTQENEEQMKLSNAMAKFIIDKTDTSALNHDTNATSFLISLPKSRKVRVLYGIGTGLGINGILPSSLDSNILALFGNVEKGVSLPKTLVLPANTLELKKIKIPSDNNFTLNVSSEANTSKDKWYKAEDITTTSFVPTAVLIPSFFVNDGFDKGLDAMVI